QTTADEIFAWLEFRRVLVRSVRALVEEVGHLDVAQLVDLNLVEAQPGEPQPGRIDLVGRGQRLLVAPQVGQRTLTRPADDPLDAIGRPSCRETRSPRVPAATA